MRRLLASAFTLAAGIVIGLNLGPLADAAAELYAILTDSPLPETSSRLDYRLTAPANAELVAFDGTVGDVSVTWEASEWHPNDPGGWFDIQYHIALYGHDGEFITKYGSCCNELDIVALPEYPTGNMAPYSGQYVKFVIWASAFVQIESHAYRFESDATSFIFKIPEGAPPSA